MKKVSIFSLILLLLITVPFALAWDDTILLKETANTGEVGKPTASAKNVARAFLPALNKQNSALLKGSLLREDVRFGAYYGAWWDGWETQMSVDDMLAEIWRYDSMGKLSAETLPNEPTWFLQNLNPYTDLLSDEAVEVVLLVGNFSENSDAELLVWISADAKVSAMVISPTGFQRTAK